MRILAIRGANLASLTSFDIDLTTDPLASAGLFAITGDTGAGKSTMLDALCLALYGEYPRATGARGEKDVDISGDAVAVKDARNILRRGAGSGFAEADFIGRDGVGYRARWETRRARQKAGGKLQPVERSIIKLDGRAAVATGTLEVEAAVIDRTGLTFDQFRRTVLLAQGEFDAFLLADEKARADLLEKITGTEVYSRISQAVHREATICADRVAQLETARGAVALLDTDVRLSLEAELRAAEEAATSKTDELTAAAAKRERAQQSAASRQRLREAEQALSVARTADADGLSDRNKLVLLGRLAPVSAKADANRTAFDAVVAARAVRAKADADMRTAQSVVTSAALSLQKATLFEGQSAAKLAAAEPLWREADAIDVQIATATRELDAAEQLAAKAKQDGEAATERIAAIARERDGLQVAIERLSAELDNSAADEALADRGREIAKLFMQRHSAAVSASNELHDAEQAQTIVANLVEAQEREHRLVIEATNRRAVISDRLKVLRAEYNSSDPGGLEEQDRALGLLLEKSREAERVAQDWRKADTDIVEAREAVVSAKAKLEVAEDERNRIEAELSRRSAVRRELGDFAVLADATLSQAAERLRDSLEHNQSCPVCGSKSHPFAVHDGSGSKLAREIAGRRDRLDVEIEGLQNRHTELTELSAEGRATVDEAQRRATIAHADKNQLAQAYAGLAKPLTAAMTACRLSFLVPAALDMRTEQTLTQITQSALRTRQQFEHVIKRRHQLRTEIDGLQTEHEELAHLREVADERHKGLASKRIDAERRLAAAEGKASEVLRVLDTFDQQLSPFLAMIGVDVSGLDVDTDVIETQLNERGALFLARRGEKERIAGRLQALLVEEAGAHAVGKASQDNVAASEATAAQRRSSLADLASKRSMMLGGASADVHRKAIMEERATAQSKRSAAADLLQAQALDHAIAIERQQAAEQTLASADSHHTATRDALAQAVVELGIAWGDVEILMALPAGTMSVLSEKIATLARLVTEAEKAVELRRADLAQIATESASQDDEVEIYDARMAALTREISELRDVIAAKRTKLVLDADARSKVGSLAGEIDEARRAHTVHQAVDMAIGSATGDRFRRHAQAITLDHLTEIANLQLSALNPRYRLVRSRATDLGLSVVDRDMGEDLRAVRSLSGGERFLVSLALALALASLEGSESFVDTLFIDEGFGALDADTLDTAIDALEMLHSQGRKVGVITHVAAMIERIAVQVRVEKRGQGRSVVRTAA